MKYIFLIALVYLSALARSQGIGANGEGLVENYTEADVEYIKQLDGKIYIAFPGGASAKYNRARLDKPGYNINLAQVKQFYIDYDRDENGTEFTHDSLEYVSEQGKRSYLYDLKELQEQTSFGVFWKCNIYTSVEECLASIRDFLSIGGTIDGLILGNEVFFVMDFDGEEYVDKVAPLAETLYNEFPEIPIIACYAQNVADRRHRQFNLSVVEFVRLNYPMIRGVDIHPYLSEQLIDAVALHPAKGDERKEVNEINYNSQFNESLSSAFDKYNTVWTTTLFYNALIDTLNKQFESVPVFYMTTEAGDIPVQLWGNTISNGAHYFIMYEVLTKHFKYFLTHNLVGNFYWAFIFRHVLHVNYYALKYALATPAETVTGIPEQVTIISPDTIWISYFNLSGQSIKLNIHSQGYEYRIEHVYSWAYTNYAANGNTGFYNRAFQSPDEIYEATDSTDIVRGYSFGYFKIIPEKIIIPGCTDPKATNYNPNANYDNGSCTYPPPPCKKPWFCVFFKRAKACQCENIVSTK